MARPRRGSSGSAEFAAKGQLPIYSWHGRSSCSGFRQREPRRALRSYYANYGWRILTNKLRIRLVYIHVSRTPRFCAAARQDPPLSRLSLMRPQTLSTVCSRHAIHKSRSPPGQRTYRTPTATPRPGDAVPQPRADVPQPTDRVKVVRWTPMPRLDLIQLSALILAFEASTDI